jgi:hypothetical protein
MPTTDIQGKETLYKVSDFHNKLLNLAQYSDTLYLCHPERSEGPAFRPAKKTAGSSRQKRALGMTPSARERRHLHRP